MLLPNLERRDVYRLWESSDINGLPGAVSPFISIFVCPTSPPDSPGQPTLSYAANIGDTDDLIMASLLVTRMLQQLSDYHYDLENQIRDHNEVIMPLPFYAVMG